MDIYVIRYDHNTQYFRRHIFHSRIDIYFGISFHYILLFSSTYQTHCNYVPKQILYVGVNVIFELACKHQNIIYISTIRFARGGKKGNTARKYFWPYSREYELGSFSKTFHGGKYIACNSLCLVSLQELNECWFGTKLQSLLTTFEFIRIQIVNLFF